jgi:hypothetical protein
LALGSFFSLNRLLTIAQCLLKSSIKFYQQVQ